jgi:hypothetical protein
MKKPLIDYLLFAARSLLVLVFLANLSICILGYFDKIVSRTYSSYEIGLRNSYSKESFWGFFAGFSLFIFLFGYFAPFLLRIIQRLKKKDELLGYWERDENIGLKNKIESFCLLLTCNAILIFYAKIQIQPLTCDFIIFSLTIFWCLIATPLTLSWVKWFRERKKISQGNPE